MRGFGAAPRAASYVSWHLMSTSQRIARECADGVQLKSHCGFEELVVPTCWRCPTGITSWRISWRSLASTTYQACCSRLEHMTHAYLRLRWPIVESVLGRLSCSFSSAMTVVPLWLRWLLLAPSDLCCPTRTLDISMQGRKQTKFVFATLAVVRASSTVEGVVRPVPNGSPSCLRALWCRRSRREPSAGAWHQVVRRDALRTQRIGSQHSVRDRCGGGLLIATGDDVAGQPRNSGGRGGAWSSVSPSSLSAVCKVFQCFRRVSRRGIAAGRSDRRAFGRKGGRHTRAEPSTGVFS